MESYFVLPKCASATLLLLALGTLIVTAASAPARSTERRPGDSIREIVGATIRPLMAKDQIPGMAIAVTVAGKPYVFDYGVASTSPRISVTDDTLFELGSISTDLLT
ncbi:MAG: serine hydrolase [Steroidobacteraceae bacterium]